MAAHDPYQTNPIRFARCKANRSLGNCTETDASTRTGRLRRDFVFRSATAQRLPEPLSVVELLPAGAVLLDPVELDAGLLDVALPAPELPDDELSDPLLPDVVAGVLPPMFRQGI